MRGVRWYLVGSLVLVALAGCGRGIMQYAQREPWRGEAEVACLRSGTIKEGAGLVRIEPIEGPGICGASHPLKVVALGESSAFGFANEAIRPPGSIPGASGPRWPIATPRAAPPPPAPNYAMPAPAPRYAPPGAPLSITPPDLEPPVAAPQLIYPQRPYSAGPPPDVAPPSMNYRLVPVRRANPPGDDGMDAEELARVPPRTAPASRPAMAPTPIPPLGPSKPLVTGAIVLVEVKPVATLACPIVSALDQWIMAAVQPAANKWFGQPVVEIKQISAYSCRGMSVQIGARISEHAFGNALDIAAFVLADGRRVTVKDGWQGLPEDQGFLRDVQGAACEQFTTVLAPGSNRFHYDHIHVDLMRRASGRRICQPGAVDGELIAARARKNPTMVASRPEPPPTRRYDPPFDPRNDPFAWRGDAVRRGDPTTTGSIGARKPAPPSAAEDDDWIEDDSPRPQIDWHAVR